MKEEQCKVLRDAVDGKVKYSRIPIARKIIGTGPNDSKILINSGVPEDLADLSYRIETGVYSLDSTLKSKDGYCASFSTTKLLCILPNIFYEGKQEFGIVLYPGPITDFLRHDLRGLIVNTKSGEVVANFSGHPITVLVKLIEYAKNHEDKVLSKD